MSFSPYWVEWVIGCSTLYNRVSSIYNLRTLFLSWFTTSTTLKAFGLMFISFVLLPTNFVFLFDSILEPFFNFLSFVFNSINVGVLWFDDGSDVYLQLQEFVVSSHLSKIDDDVPLFAICHYSEICLNLDDFEVLPIELIGIMSLFVFQVAKKMGIYTFPLPHPNLISFKNLILCSSFCIRV